MLCNTCLSFEGIYNCGICYKKPAMDILHLTTRQWSQIELIGVTESNENGDRETKKALCKGFADSIVIEAEGHRDS